MAVKQTAGRKELGEFAPKFAELNDDVLFDKLNISNLSNLWAKISLVPHKK